MKYEGLILHKFLLYLYFVHSDWKVSCLIWCKMHTHLLYISIPVILVY